jgi:phage baseplate assembly protein V
MTDQWAQSEAERMAANFIRVGVITAVDLKHEDGPRATMRVGGLDSAWLPWLAARAGDTSTASTPSVGEQRMLFSPYGDTAQGIIGGAVYQDAHPSPATTADQEVAVFKDGTRVEYDAQANKLQVDVAGAGLVVINCKAATVKADSVTLDAGQTTCTGNLTVKGNATFSGGSVTHGGKNIGKAHTHTGVQTGGGVTGAPV